MRHLFILSTLLISFRIGPSHGFLVSAPPVVKTSKSDLSKRYRASRLKATAGDVQDAPAVEQTLKKPVGNIVFLLPSEGTDSATLRFGSRSPVGNPTIADAAEHLKNKSFWFSEGLVVSEIVNIPQDKASEDLLKQLEQADALIALGLTSDSDLRFAEDIFEQRLKRDKSLRSRQCQFALECANSLPEMVSMYDKSSCGFLMDLGPWTKLASARRMYDQMQGMFSRWTSDDFTVALMLFFNQFSGSEIQWVKHSIDVTWEKGPIRNLKEFVSMGTKCGDCIVKCLSDEKCSECIDALNKLDTRDQVSSYRTIVSFESELLKDFSYCILQKNNVFDCHSTIPTMPKVAPITSWRGKPIDKKVARTIITGHLNDELAADGTEGLEVSWKVAAGANVAYDQFPSQHQLFYENANGSGMWYDPVFRVKTLDGRNVWCKRHYRVRDGKVPGTFHLSVLDNGVTSNEFWTVAGVADDLSWIVFQYAGAAAAVGQTYIGGLLCTADGSLPPAEKQGEVWKVLKGAGIQPWELFVVDNDLTSAGMIAAGPPPLRYFRDSVLEAKAKKKAEAAASVTA